MEKKIINKKECSKMAVKKGTLSIDSENIFPIIKKWVYSDHDIFVRELVSNGCDAITKLKKSLMMTSVWNIGTLKMKIWQRPICLVWFPLW